MHHTLKCHSILSHAINFEINSIGLQIPLHLCLVAHFCTNCSSVILWPVEEVYDHTLYVEYLKIHTKYVHHE